MHHGWQRKRRLPDRRRLLRQHDGPQQQRQQPTLLPRPRRFRARRGRGGTAAGGVVSCGRPRRQHPRRSHRCSQQRRCTPHHCAGTRWNRRHQVHELGTTRRRPHHCRHSSDQRARHLHSAQRCRRGRCSCSRLRSRHGAGDIHQGRHRSRTRRRWRAGGGRRAVVDGALVDPADRRNHRGGRRVRDRRRAGRRSPVDPRPDDVEQPGFRWP